MFVTQFIIICLPSVQCYVYIYCQAATVQSEGAATVESDVEPQPHSSRHVPRSHQVETTVGSQTDVCSADMDAMQMTVVEHARDTYLKVKHKQSQSVSGCEFDVSHFRNDDNRVKYYTGLHTFSLLMVVFNFVQGHVIPGKSLTKFQEFMIVMVKLRLNTGLQDLAYRAHISVATVSRIMRKWLPALDVRLTPACIVWPERETLRRTTPLCFRQSFGTKVAVIIDCFEVFVDRPTNLLARAETWSQYKHHNTCKFLIGIAPQGLISFISAAWGGRVSDKYLTENSGLLDKLLPGDVVLADRGFTIADSVAMTGAKLHIPVFTKGRDQLTALEVEESRSIANVRIHVERVIGSVRQKYTILGGPLPTEFISKTSDDEVPLIDRIVRVACSLSNLCDSVVPFS